MFWHILLGEELSVDSGNAGEIIYIWYVATLNLNQISR